MGYHSGRIRIASEHDEPKNVEAEMDMSARQETGFMDLFARGRDYVSNLTDKFSLGTKSNPGMIAVMSQSMGILEQRHKRARLMGDPPDICIVPEVGNIGTMEFHRADEAIATAGEAAVRRWLNLIEAALWKANPLKDKQVDYQIEKVGYNSRYTDFLSLSKTEHLCRFDGELR